jgi:hypothetical protein
MDIRRIKKLSTDPDQELRRMTAAESVKASSSLRL